MNRRLLGAWIIAAAALALPAHADIMYWYWQVEVNGETADASRPIVVGAGDEVEIELWASMDPELEAIASAAFALRFGDSLLSVGDLNINPDHGNGLSPAFLAFGMNGVPIDTTGDGVPDTIDDIEAWQFSKIFGEPFYNDSNPVKVYSLGWALSQPPAEPITFRHTPTTAGRYESRVYTDVFGDSRVYSNTSDQLVFVPTPVSIAVFIIAICGNSRRCRNGS